MYICAALKIVFMNKLIRSSVLAGVSIGIAGFGYLAIGGLAGAVLFAFGLLTASAINSNFTQARLDSLLK